MHSFLRATVLFSVLSGNLSDAFSPVYTSESMAIRQLFMSDIAGSNEDVDRNGQQNLMNRGLMEEELLQGDQQSFLEMASEDERQDALDRQKKLVKERKKLMNGWRVGHRETRSHQRQGPVVALGSMARARQYLGPWALGARQVNSPRPRASKI